MIHDESEESRLFEAGGALAKPQKANEPTAQPFVIVPDGWRLEQTPVSVDGPAPCGMPRLRNADSFCRYFNDHKAGESRIYAEPGAPDGASALFLAVFDDDDGNTPLSELRFSYRHWRAFYRPHLAPEWQAWAGSSGKRMNQADFAAFIEDGLPDITEPDSADLMEVILNFEVASSGRFASAQRLKDGTSSLQWRNDQQQAGTIKLPDTLRLSIPIYEGMPAQSIFGRLRFRIKDEALTLYYELIRPQRAIAAAFAELCASVAAQCTDVETPAPLLHGSP